MTAPAAQLPGFVQALGPLIDRYGYLAIGGLVMLEDFGVPVPGETMLLTGAVYAGLGQLSIVGVALVAFVGAIVGDNIGYAIGRFGGRELALRWGRYVFLTPARLDRVEGFFVRHGVKVVVIARFVEGLRQANGIVAGIAEMPWGRFLAANAAGAAIWVGLWTAVGYAAGDHLGEIYATISRYVAYFAILVGIVAVLLIVRLILRRRRAGRGGVAR